jgi:hypothetical protein
MLGQGDYNQHGRYHLVQPTTTAATITMTALDAGNMSLQLPVAISSCRRAEAASKTGAQRL